MLQKLADFSPDPCGPPYGRERDWHSADVENPLFEQAGNFVEQELNATRPETISPQDRTTESLKKLERLSAEINASWPDENRFHFQILNLPPALVLKITIRSHARFFVFGVPEEISGQPNRLWRRVGSDDESFEHESPSSWLELYPLHRGTSGNARFLAEFGYTGCAGSSGVVYDAREWNPRGLGDLDQVIKQEGAFGLDDKVPGFAQVGKLRTEGALITLPYCWFSSLDTWDNPSLCAVDTYDTSGDNLKFRSRAYNRPDLVPIAKAIEYAQRRDYPAVLSYCVSGEVARKMVRGLPPFVFAGDLRVTRTGSGKESVALGDPPAYHFHVEKHGGRWRVVAFSAD
ncbi:MAG: hypothetical protein P4K94_06965 [Terracidiphilus sp.]|nr:hypothetical protein [Terracidiphilus sp.]